MVQCVGVMTLTSNLYLQRDEAKMLNKPPLKYGNCLVWLKRNVANISYPFTIFPKTPKIIPHTKHLGFHYLTKI